MIVKVKNKEIKIPDEEIQKNMQILDITEQEAIQMWLEDEGYETNEQVEQLTKKAKQNKTILVGARENVENKKTERERKANPTKARIIEEIYYKLAEMEGISSLKVENSEKIITFDLDGNTYKLDLVQKRKK